MTRTGGKIQRFTILIFILLLILTVSFAGCTAVSAAPHATLNKASGQVSLQRAGTSTWVSVRAGTSLQLGDRIRTGPESSAVIIFFEGSVTELQADTEIRIDEMRHEAGSTTVKIREEIGTTSSRVEKLIDAKSRYEVETPAGSALVRGSVMGVIVQNDGTTIVDAIQGQCWAVAQGKEVLLTEGTRSIIRKGSAPSGAASPSAAVNPPANVSPPGQGTAFFNIEPFEDTGGKDLMDILPPLPCQIQVVTVGYQEELGDISFLRLMGRLVNICPNPDVRVSFEWGFETGVYDYGIETEQSMTSTGDFFFDYNISQLIDLFYTWLDDHPQPPSTPVIYFRAKATWGTDGISYGVEKEYEVPW
jgi:hypothetical protein